jgi:hypothetical protein
MAQEAHPDSHVPGIAKPVLPMHIYNLCLGRTKLPALVLDIRSAEDFKMFHIVNSLSCPVESPTVHFSDIERTLAAAPDVLQRLQNRRNVAIGVVSNLPPFLQPNLSFIQRIRLVMSFQWPRQWPSCWRVTCRPTTRRAPPAPSMKPKIGYNLFGKMQSGASAARASVTLAVRRSSMSTLRVSTLSDDRCPQARARAAPLTI